MTILIPPLAVAFAAICVWLTVRIVNRRERWAKWTLAATIIGTPVLYVLTFGPACWWFSNAQANLPERGIAPRFYWPIGWVAANGPDSCRRAIRWYAILETDGVDLPTSYNGSRMPVFRGP